MDESMEFKDEAKENTKEMKEPVNDGFGQHEQETTEDELKKESLEKAAGGSIPRPFF